MQSGSTLKNRRTGMLYMSVAAILFPVKDGLIKGLSGSITALEAGFVYFSIQAFIAILYFSIIPTKKLDFSAHPVSVLLFARSAFQVLAIVLFFYAIQFAPLAESVVLFTANALFVVFFSMLLLKENVSLKLLCISLIGFVGVVVILNPTLANFTNNHLLYALMSAIVFALYIVITRVVGQNIPPTQILFVDGVFGSLILLFSMVLAQQFGLIEISLLEVEASKITFLMLSGTIGTLSALLIISAMKLAPASVVAPFGYLEILSAAVIGILIFGEGITVRSIIGSIIVILAAWGASVLKMKSEQPT